MPSHYKWRHFLPIKFRSFRNFAFESKSQLNQIPYATLCIYLYLGKYKNNAILLHLNLLLTYFLWYCYLSALHNLFTFVHKVAFIAGEWYTVLDFNMLSCINVFRTCKILEIDMCLMRKTVCKCSVEWKVRMFCKIWWLQWEGFRRTLLTLL